MRGDVIEIRARGDIILIGGAGALSGLPETLRQRSAGCSAIRHLSGETQAIHELRHFWLRRFHPHSIGLSSDRDLLNLVAAGVACGDVQVVVLPAHHVRARHSPLARAAAAPSGRIAQVAGPAVVRAPAAATPPAPAKPAAGMGFVAAPAPRMVSRMTMGERLAEVLRRAAARLPRTMGAELLALVTPESIATALGLAALGAAANLTPYGWAADLVLAAIAFGFGGLAAIHALGDLVTCFELIAGAEAERELDEAAEALSRAVAALGTAGLMAILHERAKRWGGDGGEGPQAEEPWQSTLRPRPRVPQTTPSAPEASPVWLPIGNRPIEPKGAEAATWAQIKALPKGKRPAAKDYIRADAYEAHIAKFDAGASRFVRKSALEKYGPSQADGTAFVMPKSEADAIIAKTAGDKRAMEKALGFPEHSLEDDELIRVNFDDPRALGLRIPSGNEAGANSLWIPGGKLPTGLNEAVIDVPTSTTSLSKYGP